MKRPKRYNDASVWQIGFFSLNNAAINLYMAMMIYVSYYANGIAGMSVAIVSILLTGLHIFDGITDPIAGFFLDQTNGRFGKFRPFMLIGNVIMACSSLALFFTTQWIPYYFRIPYFAMLYACFVVGFTLQSVVGKSGQTVITNNPEKRPLFAYFDSLFVMASYGGISLYVSVYLVPKYGGFQAEGLYKEMCTTIVIAAFLATILAIAGIWNKDHNKYYETKEKKERIRIRDYFDIIGHNRPIRMLIIAACTDRFAATVYGHATVGVMLYGVLMKDYTIAGLIGVVTALPTLVVVTFGIKVAQWFGQKKALVYFTVGAIILQIPMGAILLSSQVSSIRFSLYGMNTITWLFVTVYILLNGCKSITNNMVTPMIADCTDYEVYRSGKYVPGLMGALFSFVDKTFQALGTAFVGIALVLLGFDKQLPQVGDKTTVLIKTATIFMYCIIPIIGWICTILAMKFYQLDKKKMKEING
ncbi:MAG: MFS transporter [Velocimicrobium sp.]